MAGTPDREPSGSRTPSIPHSSAAFLHHLHNDPTSHHITLSASISRLGNPGASLTSSPHSLDVPLEPTVTRHNEPSGSPGRSLISPPPSSPAGPSALRGLGTSPSENSRLKSASSAIQPDGLPLSPPVEDGARMEDYPHAGLSVEDLPILAAEGDSCIYESANDEAGLSAAMNSLSVSGREEGTFLLGRAGSLGITDDRSSTSGSISDHPEPERLSWSVFSRSYAHGLFDPRKIPDPPRYSMSLESPSSAQSSPGKPFPNVSRPLPQSSTSGSSGGTFSETSASSAATVSTHASSAPSTSAGAKTGATSLPPRSMATAMAARKKAFELENLPDKTEEGLLRPDRLKLPSYSLAAATVRMASSHLRDADLAPLAIPSPERELMDPMSSMVSDHSRGGDSASSDPGTSRYPLSRSMSSAVSSSLHPSTLLPTIQASPVNTPAEGSHRKGKGRAQPEYTRTRTSPTRFRGGIVNIRIPAATAPIEKTHGNDSLEDYFGAAATPSPPHPRFERQTSSISQSSSSQTITAGATPVVQPAPHPPSAAAERRRSAPDPEIPGAALPGEMGSLYERLGYLPAPIPPNELARRKALYRFNILHTMPDANFDRIAHMAKLVFSSKIVLISLVDAEKQWYKSHSGMGKEEESSRISSFCGHAVVGKTDEPFVVLDTKLDWRFEQNPQVIGFPHIRFYAGAPLRTFEGHNIGSLCIIDDKPRDEFPPRSRLILKEFAAVAMREMELWRDKLQLRIRDRMQTSMERFTRECLEMDAKSSASNAQAAAKMDQVYSRAASLVCSTLDLDGCFILDTSQFEMTEIQMPDGSTSTVYRADPYVSETQSPVLERSDSFGPVNPFPIFATTPHKLSTRPLSAVDHQRLSDFLRDYRDGRIFESIAPSWIRHMFPADLRFGMAVPVFGVDQQPFAMICAYTSKVSKQYLEGYELQFLRAIGVIILSAVLRRRMVLADKTKSTLISSVSHELRTPLHGILAAAELLSDTDLDPNQVSFLKTVQTCGHSLIETVNHVLDFTKLSGSASGSTGSTIKLARVNLANLVEQTVESCWIGQRARFFHGDSDIGSFYAPDAPSGMVPKSQRATIQEELEHVETVIDIAQREKGWSVRCEKGGLRRVLMNLVGNSLKFTKNGYIQVTLRELPHPAGATMVPIEMAVIDTGKGIGKEFLKDQLFHPFSQENPLQTGTGLGLAIVNSIVRSENVNGKVDVWSSEGVGTEIRVSFDVEVIDEEDDMSSGSSSVSAASTPGRGHSISFLSFVEVHRGQGLNLEVLSTYAAAWQFELKDEAMGEILVINDEDQELAKFKDDGRPIVYLTSGRRTEANAIRDRVNKAGGYVQIMYKPIGPSSFRKVLASVVDWMDDRDGTKSQQASTPGLSERPSLSRGSSGASAESNSTISELSSKRFSKLSDSRMPLMRRRSEENEAQQSRPSMAPRGMTYHHPPHTGPSPSDDSASIDSNSPQLSSPTSTFSTISLADGGVMLRAATVPMEGLRSERVPRVLVVEDNVINRRVLAAFLKKRGMEFSEAVNGAQGVRLFEEMPPSHWDVILMDISMPVMNGHEATRAIRRIEATRHSSKPPRSVIPPPGGWARPPPRYIVQGRAKIFALTGLATSDDKREAFGSGVDGYLVKPVSLKSLGLIFQKIGFPMDTPISAS